MQIVNKIVVILSIVLMPCINVSALAFTSTIADMPSTSSTTINLINYAQSYKSFAESDFVVFNDSQYSYYIVWGKDLIATNNRVTATNIEYIRYYRTSSSSNYYYTYQYGTSINFGLTSNYVNTSSLESYGFKSQLYEEYRSNIENQYFIVITISFLFVIMIRSLRRNL